MEVQLTRYVPFILITVFANAAAQILLKKGMTINGDGGLLGSSSPFFAMRDAVLRPAVLLGTALYVVAMGSHLVVLSKLDVSVAYPLLSLAYIVVAIYAFFMMHEPVSSGRIAGLLFVCFGIWLIAASSSPAGSR
jgi:drug/metabolite transporter (DMT)-like permease